MQNKLEPKFVDQLTYDILTVQPMVLYQDDIEYLIEHAPHVLKDPSAEFPNTPFPKYMELPVTFSEDIRVQYRESMNAGLFNNGWKCVKPEFRMEADRAVCTFRKEKYKHLLHD